MHIRSSLLRLLLIPILYFVTTQAPAQPAPETYKSLLWEISGHGLRKPSYLFGTMHISNKMVFNLSDSFYQAIRNSDVVAIELDPEQWQAEIPRMNRQGDLYKYYYATYYTDYLRENTFTATDFLPGLQRSLRFEPALNDALLYRNESQLDNFQEDTYLDLYIYQTGKKLGKKTTGVETYMGSQRMMIEAMVDAEAQKNTRRREEAGTAYYRLGQDLQDAYRRGDLDMLDSLNRISEYAESFTEKFLYKRNEMQADAMDSIMQQESLFAGVGAAHLPGKRGVIELLRSKGYKLRPVYMAERDATQKRAIDSMTIPVVFSRQYAADSLFSVSVPGRLNEIKHPLAALLHYADMGNGAYYLVTRIGTQTLYSGKSQGAILRTIDSLLYENIPGTILSKKTVIRNGYEGLDIINRTKKGDVQHYQLYLTPLELLVFKMGGKGDYVTGKEAETFFGSIELKEQETQAAWRTFEPASGGFRIAMPVAPKVTYSPEGRDQLPEWRYEATEPGTGDQYAVIRKSMYSFSFVGADTFDLMLMQESLGSNRGWEIWKQNNGNAKGRPFRERVFKTPEGDYVTARAVLLGPQYYLLLQRSRKQRSNPSFFSSFAFSPFKYPSSRSFTDTSLHFTVRTSVYPQIDADMMDMMMYVKKKEEALKKDRAYTAMPDNSFANLISEETGEVVVLNSLRYPEYAFVEDSTSFWKSLLQPDSSMRLQQQTPVLRAGGAYGWQVDWADTASTRIIRRLVLRKGMYLLSASTMTDTTLPAGSFTTDVFRSLDFYDVADTPGLFEGKQERFFKDYYSADTAVSRSARSALASVYYGKAGYPALLEALQKLRRQDKDYYETKTKLIAELGYLRDSTLAGELARELGQRYLDAGDTTLFQNSALTALSNLHSPEATALFKELILQDPPAFEERYGYSALFQAFGDSLRLAAMLYPELMNLTTIEDFKTPVRTLLVALLDSNYLKPPVYEDYVGNIFFDAKIALKKMQNASESLQGQAVDEEDHTARRYTRYQPGDPDDRNIGDMSLYIDLLAPYYKENPNIRKFFDKLQATGDADTKMDLAFALLQQGYTVPDSTWQQLASDKRRRLFLWSRLQRCGQSQLMPPAYRTAEAVAAAYLYAHPAVDTLVYMDKHVLPAGGTTPVTAFIYKYRSRGSDTWKLAISSTRPSKNKLPEPDDTIFLLEDKKLKGDAAKEAAKALRRLMIGRHESGREFFSSSSGEGEGPADQAFMPG